MFGDYFFTRLIFRKGLALVYLIAFFIAFQQARPLIGENGLLPITQFIKVANYIDFPSLFFIFPKDSALAIVAFLGIMLSFFALSGLSEKFGLILSITTWFLLWLFYLSFVNVGQIFYGFGWEFMLLEAGFLSIFLGDSKTKVPLVIMLLLRFELFKLILGAGLIKLRGDSCWHDFTCLLYHYETQPIPNPLSWYFHHMPPWFQQMGVVFTYLVEIGAPFFYFISKFFAGAIAGAITIFFQLMLISSGNFAFLNLLTIVLATTTFDDRILTKLFRRKTPNDLLYPNIFKQIVTVVSFVLILINIFPILNLLSPNQVMNASYDPLRLVGTYGMFGSITRPRYEVIVEGTSDPSLASSTKWKEYEFFGKPGALNQLPPQIAPYHLRLDWLMWFAAFTPTAQDPWFYHFVQKLLLGDKQILSLLKTNPFGNSPPKYVRAERYIYHFTTSAEKEKTGAWWTRKLDGIYLPPVSLKDKNFNDILNQFGW